MPILLVKMVWVLYTWISFKPKFMALNLRSLLPDRLTFRNVTNMCMCIQGLFSVTLTQVVPFLLHLSAITASNKHLTKNYRKKMQSWHFSKKKKSYSFIIRCCERITRSKIITKQSIPQCYFSWMENLFMKLLQAGLRWLNHEKIIMNSSPFEYTLNV